MADDVAAVLDHAKTPRAHIYGISMGGMIAQEFALSIPAHARSRARMHQLRRESFASPADPDNVAKLIPATGESSERAGAAGVFGRLRHGLPEFGRGTGVLSQAIAEMGKYPITPMHTFMRQGQAIGRFDSFARLGQIKSPTLIIHGDDDRSCRTRTRKFCRARLRARRSIRSKASVTCSSGKCRTRQHARRAIFCQR